MSANRDAAEDVAGDAADVAAACAVAYVMPQRRHSVPNQVLADNTCEGWLARFAYHDKISCAVEIRRLLVARIAPLRETNNVPSPFPERPYP